MITIKQPVNQKDWDTYFNLRWKILREPWNKPQGSERDDLEEQSFHVMALSTNQEAIGCGRLHRSKGSVGQIRYMGVLESARGMGVGKILISALETLARKERMNEIILNAREEAVPFYKANGYAVREKSYLMWNSIQHFLMAKEL